MGMVTLGNIMSQIISGRITPESPIVNSMYKNFKKVNVALPRSASFEIKLTCDQSLFPLRVPTFCNSCYHSSNSAYPFIFKQF